MGIYEDFENAKGFEVVVFGLNVISLVLLMIAVCGASTQYMPNDERSPMSDLSMWTWRPRKEFTYMWGLTRVVEMEQVENLDAADDNFLSDDDLDDEYNWYFKAWAYEDCMDEANSFPAGSMSEELCTECFYAGDRVKGILFAAMAIFIIATFVVPGIIIFGLGDDSNLKKQMLFMVALYDIYWDEVEAKKGEAQEGVTNYMTENFGKGPALVWTVYQFLYPIFIMAMLSAGVGEFQPCIEEIKKQYNDTDSMRDGPCKGLLIAAAVFMSLTVIGKLCSYMSGTKAMTQFKKDIDMYRLEGPKSAL